MYIILFLVKVCHRYQYQYAYLSIGSVSVH